MHKLCSITYKNHPVLGNLHLDFCDRNGNPVDTVIIAGENGTGKSTVIDSIYRLVSRDTDSTSCEADLEFDIDGSRTNISYEKRPIDCKPFLYGVDKLGIDRWIGSSEFRDRYPTTGIFSDVDINFHTSFLSSVTSMVLDAETDSRRSSENLPTIIGQLIIDIQALDDAEVARAVQKNPAVPYNDLSINLRMPRFIHAFNFMFDDLAYSRIENKDGHKIILFQKNGKDIPIDLLSSGEKQIVYRGSFMLKDVNATNGAFVFIDEPEISLHPTWQMKILDFYKGIFTQETVGQTSQIFCVTHSPFIIHNDNRTNDKVLVLYRDEEGCILVKDEPSYYKCNSTELVRDAFSIDSFDSATPTVYLEGRTDEKYFNKAVEVYGYDTPFRFAWVGHLNDRGQEVFTGCSSLEKAIQFLTGQNLSVKNACLFDCDTGHQKTEINNVLSLSMPTFDNANGISKGIENALVLDGIDLSQFYTLKEDTGDYGEKKRIQEFQKMKFCDYICGQSVETSKIVFSNLKGTIEQLIEFFTHG